MSADILAWAVIIGSAVWVFFDARSIVKQTKSIEIAEKVSPILWLIGVFAFWIVFFPLYIFKRAGYRQQEFNFKSPATAVSSSVFLGFILLCVLTFTGDIKLSTADLKDQVQENIVETWKGETEISNIKVHSFILFHKSGNQYEGMMDVTLDDERAKLVIDVTYDGKGFMWQVRGV